MGRQKLVVIDGLDGSGKATQADLLLETLQKEGEAVRKISFPDYANPSSTLAKMYLDGKIGTLDEVNAYAASSFYSVDRYVSYLNLWKADYQAGVAILADRYSTSNACHQMAKLPKEEWDLFLDWLEDFEYGKLELPKPDLVIYLDMHPEASCRLLALRYGGDESKKDIHEANFLYTLRCREAAHYAAGRWNWKMIVCSDENGPLPIDEIAKKVMETYKKYTN